MSVLRGRPPGFAAGIQRLQTLPLRITQIAGKGRSRLLVGRPMRLRPHPELKPPSHLGGGELRAANPRYKLLDQALRLHHTADIEPSRNNGLLVMNALSPETPGINKRPGVTKVKEIRRARRVLESFLFAARDFESMWRISENLLARQHRRTLICSKLSQFKHKMSNI